MVVLLSLCAVSNAELTEDWVARYDNGTGAGNDRAHSVAIDSDGNVYTAGRSHGPETDFDFVVVKYDATGDEQWVARYRGAPEFLEESALHVVVDAAGCAYATGYMYIGSTIHCFTVKLDPDGNTVWQDLREGQSWGMELVVDDSGYVYLAAMQGNRYMTIKYGPGGVEEWVAMYPEVPTGEINRISGIALDALRNVHVTGSSYTAENEDDFLTVKYDTDGNELWAARYDRLQTAVSEDAGLDVAVDSDGTVCVTGISRYIGPGAARIGHYFSCTVSYDAAGNELWAALYRGPTEDGARTYSVAFGDSGAVYVGGRAESDYLAVKYGPDGTELWLRTHDCSGTGPNNGTAMALDSDENVYVSGWSDDPVTNFDFATVSYSSDGTERWVARFDGKGHREEMYGLAVRGDGLVCVAGLSGDGYNDGNDFSTVVYDGLGTELWSALYSGQGDEVDLLKAMALHPSGGVCVTGASYDGPAGHVGRYAIAAIRYGDAGSELWVNRRGRAYSSRPHAIAVDEVGNAVVSTALTNDAYYDYVESINYDIAGLEQWSVEHCWGSWYLTTVGAAGSVFDSAGNLYVAGISGDDRLPPHPDLVTIKCDAAGNDVWLSRFEGAYGGYDVSRAIALGPNGNVYVAGCTQQSSSQYDLVLIKYDADGSKLWDVTYPGTASKYGGAYGLAIDDSGFVYVAGATYDGSAGDWVVLKYDADGNEIWSDIYAGGDVLDDKPCGLELGPFGGVFVAGYEEKLASGMDYLAMKYDCDGTRLWSAHYGGEGDDAVHDLVVDALGRLYVTGRSEGVGTYGDCVTIQYDGDGTEMCVASYDGPDHAEDLGEVILVDASGVVYVGGYSWGSETGRDYMTLKYTPGSTGVQGSFHATATESGDVCLLWTIPDLSQAVGLKLYRSTSRSGPYSCIHEGELPPHSSGQYIDSDAWPCTEFWYDLRMVMGDGSEEQAEWGPVNVFTGGSLRLALHRPLPNPSSGAAELRFDIPRNGTLATLAIYSVDGRLMRVLAQGPQSSGRHVLTWDGRDRAGHRVGSGVYFARLQAGDEELAEKLVVIR